MSSTTKVSARQIAGILAGASQRRNAESDMRSRLRWMTGVCIPKGTGGKAGAGAARLSPRDAVMMLLGMAADQAIDAGTHAVAVGNMVGYRSEARLVDVMEGFLRRRICGEDICCDLVLPKFRCAASFCAQVKHWRGEAVEEIHREDFRFQPEDCAGWELLKVPLLADNVAVSSPVLSRIAACFIASPCGEMRDATGNGGK